MSGIAFYYLPLTIMSLLKISTFQLQSFFNRIFPSLFAVSMETTVGAGLGMCVLVVIFFLYMNRKWCFSSTSGNFPCCDEKSLSTKTIHSFSEYFSPLFLLLSAVSWKWAIKRTLKINQGVVNWDVQLPLGIFLKSN